MNINFLQPLLYFSYNQFMVYDQSESLPGCLWTEQHYLQGFARRDSTINFGTLLEFGYAKVTAYQGKYQPKDQYLRVISVPFQVKSGTILIEGPDEIATNRFLKLESGYYDITAAQFVISDEEEVIDIFFEALPKPLKCSSIIVADKMLFPQVPLIENAFIAE